MDSSIINYMMKKTIYISDLDGTLLEPDATLSAETAERLNALIRQGAAVTAATARTWATVRYILKDVQLQQPVILMNGVCLYDPVEQRYLKVTPIPQAAMQRMLDAMEAEDAHGFLYRIRDDQLTTYYDKITNQPMDHFKVERETLFQKLFLACDRLREEASDDTVYLSLIDLPEHLSPVYERIKGDPDLHIEYYKDIYDEGYWYLEVSSGEASKAVAVRWLKEFGGYDELVVFGDNLNDLSMFAAADRAYAVANAVPAVKEKADQVIGANTACGVPAFIEQELKEAADGDL